MTMPTMSDVLWFLRNVLTLKGFTTCRHKRITIDRKYMSECADCGAGMGSMDVRDIGKE